MTNNNLLDRTKALKLHGLLNHWDEVSQTSWIENLITWEEQERSQRSLDRRLSSARLGKFKSIDEFDWDWPGKM